MRGGPFDVQMRDAHIGQLGRPGNERVEQHGRRGTRSVDVDMVTGPDVGNGFRRTNDAHVRSLWLAAGRAPCQLSLGRVPNGPRSRDRRR